MLIIANIVFILFYLQVEPVFLPACLNKAIQITSVSSISATRSVDKFTSFSVMSMNNKIILKKSRDW